jgi:hypothetical protein
MNTNPIDKLTEDLSIMAGLAESNRTPDSIIRDSELEIVKIAYPPVDLSKIPQEEHSKYNSLAVVIPEKIKAYLAECVFPLSKDEIQMIEIQMDKYHNIAPPSGIGMSLDMQQTGKTWSFIQEKEKYDTGFTYYYET